MCMCACAYKCVSPRACEKGAVCLAVCMCMCACARVRTSVSDRERVREVLCAYATASPVYESSEGGKESAYDDRMSLERLCAT